MSAKIYDTTQQAFVDAETPKVHDGSAYVDSQGMSYDSGAWKVDWDKKFVLYDSGHFYGGASVNDSRTPTVIFPQDYELTINANDITGTCNNNLLNRGKELRLTPPIDIRQYTNITVEYNLSVTQNSFVLSLMLSQTATDASDTGAISTNIFQANTSTNGYQSISVPIQKPSGSWVSNAYIAIRFLSLNSINSISVKKIYLS